MLFYILKFSDADKSKPKWKKSANSQNVIFRIAVPNLLKFSTSMKISSVTINNFCIIITSDRLKARIIPIRYAGIYCCFSIVVIFRKWGIKLKMLQSTVQRTL